MEEYSHKKIEQKWQERWREADLFKTDKKDESKEKFYILDMFPYPSGSGLHMGHTEQAAATDTLYRFHRMNGKNVLHPQGFDSFGLPAENYAIKTGIHPKESTNIAIKTFRGQMNSLGLAYDFTGNVTTSEPSYYKWTQWIFGKFFENDLVYKKVSTINWCSSCNTVIANEQVVNGRCDRCDTEIEQKKVPGFFFKITDFADDLIADLDKVDWPEHTIKNQRNWIGKSEGAYIDFQIKDMSDSKLKIFTTRPDTIFGATYMVLAPEHPLVKELKEKIENYDEVSTYVDSSQKKTELERMEGNKKTGVELKGIKAINPAREKSQMNNTEIPVFISDYVLASYGTGAIMAVPAHDERDFEFAKKFSLLIVEVISGGDITKEAYVGDGELVNSGEFSGKSVAEAKKAISKFVDGNIASNYRLRDWSISRQRYWGCPIPVVYSPEGKAQFVGEENLPWLLPKDVDFVPTGEAPLTKSEELKERVGKLFGKGWTPEFDTMDTFVDSSWYFLRYPDSENDKEFSSAEMLKKWMPVDLYIGGAEHTYMHLLYARFFVKAMKKMGLLDFDEPFKKLRHQGMVNDQSGKKMSKSKDNVVAPDDMVDRFGADSTRMYMLFASPLEDDILWNETNIVGLYRFLEKVWKQSEKITDTENLETKKVIHKTIKKVGSDTENLCFNTAIAEMMKCINFISKQDVVNKDDFLSFLKILSPYAPHVAEELYEKIGENNFLIEQDWPKYDESLIVDDLITLGVQVNGKKRCEISISLNANQDEVERLARECASLNKWTKGGIKKVIYVPGRILNFVV